MRWRLPNLVGDLRRLGASRAELARLTAFTLLFSLFEGAGIGLLLPILDFIAQGQPRLDPRAWPELARLLDAIGDRIGHHDLLVLLLLAFASLCIRSFCNYMQGRSGARLSLELAANLRKRAVDAFLASDWSFLSTRGSGQLFGALTLEVARASEALAARVVFLSALSLLLVYFVLLLWLSLPLFLLTLPVFVLGALVFKRVGAVLTRLGRTVSDLNQDFGRIVAEQLRGMERVKMRGQEAVAAASLDATIDAIAATNYRIERWRLLADIGMFPALVMSAFGVLFVAVQVLGVSLSSLGLFLFILMRVAPQFTLLNGLWSHLHACMASFETLSGLIDEARSRRERSTGTRAFERLAQGVTLDAVTFAYPAAHSGTPALHALSCEIPAGALTAVVGRSGAGKSTLLKLLLRFHRPQSGRILVDGTPLDEFDLVGWRRKLAYLPQEPFLFDETVRANVGYGLAQPLDDARLGDLLVASHCAGFVGRLEAGLETRVGEAGQRLSQGQRQRLALAHALAVGPELLLLDEPTSALDSESEQAIHQTLMGLRGRLTMIVVAHRLTTIRNADLILLIDDGRLVDHGPHEALLERSELYRSLFERQLIP